MNTTTNQPRGPMADMSTDQLTDLFQDWLRLNNYDAKTCGDAGEMMDDPRVDDTHREWLANFCSAWAFAEAIEQGEGGVEIARLQVGPADMCRMIVVRQHAPALFSVTNYEQADDEKSSSRTQRYTSAAAAFQRATVLMADEVADICDTVEG